MAYTVKKGDTLQGLYGPNWKTISGFTGDPTKLQIGTQLPDIPVKPGVSSVMPSIQPPIPSVQSQTPQISTQQPVQPQISPSLTPGATLPPTPATTQPTADEIATALMAKLGGAGIQETPESRRQSYLDFITGQQKTYGEQLGIPGQEARLSPIKQQIDQTNEMLDKLEADLNERVKGLGVGENLRRRYLAAEQGPLTQQLGELGRAYAPLSSELQTSKQKLAEMMGTSKEAFEYGQEQTPQEKFAQLLAQEQAMKAGGLGTYAKIEEKTPTEKYGAGVIGEYNFYQEQEKKAGRTPLTFDAYQTMDANRKAKIAAAASGSGLDWKTTNYIEGVSKAFDSSPIVKQFNEVQNKFYSVKNIIDAGVGGPGDLALVFEFMKGLDPTSVVRESEYSTAAKSGNIFAGWAAKFNGYLKEEGGFLPENVKKSFLNIVGIKFNAIQSQYNNLRNEKSRQINLNTGVSDAERYLTNYNFDLGLGKEKETYSINDVKDDIQNLAEKYHYNFGREQMIEDLFALYSPYGITKQEIIDQVYPITNQLWGKK